MATLVPTPVVLRRGEQAVLLGALALVTVAAWVGVIGSATSMSRGMADMAGMAGMEMSSAGWSPHEAQLMVFMWVVMMLAMMLPAAGPMLMTYAGMARRSHPPVVATLRWWAFASGYLLVWAAFGLTAAGLHWGFNELSLMAPGSQLAPVAGGVVLVAAGTYEFSPVKRLGLASCRSPLGFLLHEWRDGGRGALVMGVRHGVMCSACCLGLMLVLFAVGVMSLFWMAVLTALVTAEKLLPRGQLIARVGGAGLVVGGVGLLAVSLVA